MDLELWQPGASRPSRFSTGQVEGRSAQDFAVLGDHGEAKGFEVCVKREARNIVEECRYDDEGNSVAEGEPPRLHVPSKHLLGFGEKCLRCGSQLKCRFHRIEKLDGGVSMEAIREQSNCFTDHVPGRKHPNP